MEDNVFAVPDFRDAPTGWYIVPGGTVVLNPVLMNQNSPKTIWLDDGTCFQYFKDQNTGTRWQRFWIDEKNDWQPWVSLYP